MSKTQTRNAKRYELEEQRRLQAGPLFEQGLPNAEVARRLGVSRQTASGWCARWRAQGENGLRSQKPGPVPRLTDEQRRELAEALVAGPQAAGLAAWLWTLAHIAALVQSRFGVSYHPGHLWYVLRDMGFTCQKPERRARERDEAAITAWKERTWPQIKRGP